MKRAWFLNWNRAFLLPITMSAELLKMLALSSPRRETPTGGKPELSWREVSQVLGRLPKHVSCYGRLKYSDNARDRFQELFKHGAICEDLHRETLKTNSNG